MDIGDLVATFFRVLPQAILSGVALGSVYALIAQGFYVTFTTTGSRVIAAIECPAPL